MPHQVLWRLFGWDLSFMAVFWCMIDRPELLLLSNSPPFYQNWALCFLNSVCVNVCNTTMTRRPSRPRSAIRAGNSRRYHKSFVEFLRGLRNISVQRVVCLPEQPEHSSLMGVHARSEVHSGPKPMTKRKHTYTHAHTPAHTCIAPWRE